MQMALSDAGTTPDKIDYINAHGTSTPENDKMECMCVSAVFGEHRRTCQVDVEGSRATSNEHARKAGRSSEGGPAGEPAAAPGPGEPADAIKAQ